MNLENLQTKCLCFLQKSMRQLCQNLVPVQILEAGKESIAACMFKKRSFYFLSNCAIWYLHLESKPRIPRLISCLGIGVFNSSSIFPSVSGMLLQLTKSVYHRFIFNCPPWPLMRALGENFGYIIPENLMGLTAARSDNVNTIVLNLM